MVMQTEQSRRALAALQEFLTTPLETMLNRHTQSDPAQAALALYHEVAATVPAYWSFLAEHHVHSASVQTSADFQNLPLATKKNYILRHSLADRCRDGKIESCDIIAVSSGS